MSPRANASASKGSRSSADSPTPDVADGHAELAHHRHRDAALGGAVELGEHEAGHARRLGELAALVEAVGAHGGVEHEQRLVRRARAPRAPATRAILASSAIRLPLVCRRPAVSTSTASWPRLRADAQGVGEHGRRDRRPSAPRWNGDSVRCAQISSCSAAAARNVSAAHSSVVRPSAFQAARQLADGGGLPHAVHADHEHHPRASSRTGRTASGRSSDLADLVAQQRAHGGRRRPSRPASCGRAAPPSRPGSPPSRSRTAISASSMASRSSGFSGRRPRTRSSTSAFRMSRVRSSPLLEPVEERGGQALETTAPGRCGRARSSDRRSASRQRAAGGEREDEVVAVLERAQDERRLRVAAGQVTSTAPAPWRAPIRRATASAMPW